MILYFNYQQMSNQQIGKNVSEIGQCLLQDDTFRFLLKDCIKDQMRILQQQKNIQSGEDMSVSVLVGDINSCVVQIAQATLMKQTANNFTIIHNKVQELITQQNIQLELMLKDYMNNIKQQLLKQMKQFVKSQLNKVRHVSMLRKDAARQQRRVLGMSIMNCSNIRLSKSVFKRPNDQNRSICDSMDGDISIESTLVQRPSLPQVEMNELSSKIVRFQEQQTKLMKIIEESYKRRLEIAQNDVHKLSGKLVQFKFKVQQKLQAGFSGIWNVIANIQQKLMKIPGIDAHSR